MNPINLRDELERFKNFFNNWPNTYISDILIDEYLNQKDELQ
jgi:hypothetical protein